MSNVLCFPLIFLSDIFTFTNTFSPNTQTDGENLFQCREMILSRDNFCLPPASFLKFLTLSFQAAYDFPLTDEA